MKSLCLFRGTAPLQFFWIQNAAIFACCANLFSTVLANVGFLVFLVLFLWICVSENRRYLDRENFPSAVAVAIAIYIGWQIVGLSYTDASMSDAVKSIFAERKIVYILPLALVFSDEPPKRRFLAAFLITSSVALALSFALKIPAFNPTLRFNPCLLYTSDAA